jgi:MoxR-like ATPase
MTTRKLPPDALPALVIPDPVFPGEMYDYHSTWDWEVAALEASRRTDNLIVLVPQSCRPDELMLRAEAGDLIATAAQVVGRSTGSGVVRLRGVMRVRLSALAIPPDLPSTVGEPIEDDDTPALEALANEVRHLLRDLDLPRDRELPTSFWILRPGALADLVAPLLYDLRAPQLRGLLEAPVGLRLSSLREELLKRRAAPAVPAAVPPAPARPATTATDLREQLVVKIRAHFASARLDPDLMRAIEARVRTCASDTESAQRDMRYLEALPFGRFTRPVRNVSTARRALMAELGAVDDVGRWALDRVPLLGGRAGLGRPLLLVGPPGVGKTRRAEAVAQALRLPSFTISGGGLSDAYSIRGVRSLFTRAQPGMLVSALMETGVMNPVVILDEVDKLGDGGIHGRAADALLHALEPQQARAFRDDFLEFPLDLSRVLFIATANDLEAVPRTLRDRFEVVRVEPYTTTQRRHIVANILIPRLRREYGLDRRTLLIPATTQERLVARQSGDPGLRALANDLRTLFIRGKQLALGGRRVSITAADLDRILGHRQVGHPDRCVICGTAILDASEHARLMANDLPMAGAADTFPVAVHVDCLRRPNSYLLANANEISARVAADAVVWKWILSPPDSGAPGSDPALAPRR